MTFLFNLKERVNFIKTTVLMVLVFMGIGSKEERLILKFHHGDVGPMDNFFRLEVETLYQCLELCYQFNLCNAITFKKLHSMCYLHVSTRSDLHKSCQCDAPGWNKQHFNEMLHLAGACMNHTCSMDTRCMALAGTNKHVCVPHGLPTFVCPIKWLRHDKSCYRVFRKKATWQTAYVRCKRHNGTLIEIHDQIKYLYIKAVLRHFSHNNAHETVEPGGQLYWTALTDHMKDGEWVWRVSGQMLNGFKKWTNNATTEMLDPGNDCVGLSSPDNFKWKPVKCGSLFFYVCEMLMVTR